MTETQIPFGNQHISRVELVFTNGPFGEIKETLGGIIMSEPNRSKKRPNSLKVARFCKEKATA